MNEMYNRAMRSLTLCTLALLLSRLPAAAGALDYPVSKKTLANGLDVVVIETPEFKDVLSYNTMLLAGSGREQEKGKTGLAHLFEHILFRHRIGGVEGAYDDAMSKLGTHNNAWTWFDITYYHPLTFKGNLEDLAELEAARFMGLDFSEKTFKTESGAVLGEYRRGASDPSEKMSERLLAALFGAHPYGHTTMGYEEDVLAMPNQFEAAKRFYDDHYRPNNAVLIVAGDVKAEPVFKLAEKRYKAWKAKPVPKLIAAAPGQTEELKLHVPWDADVAPAVWVAYRMPAFKPGAPDSSAGALLGELLAAPAAPLFKKLRYEKQTASALGLAEGSQGFESFEPRLLTMAATLFKDKFDKKGKAYFDEVAGDLILGMDQLKDFSKQPGASELLEVVKSKYRYDFLAGLSSPEKIASTLAWYYRFDRDPKALDALLDGVAAVTPADIDALAQRWFAPQNRAIVTMAYDPSSKKGK